ncbi:hypothetical protein [Solimicrobium silvestre]|uniref:Uncharacterized protein n=1 Tax=Solimicrobium silvestre TaxID=2099400 RepID=A0A2S9GSN5_9BURK|nr:hypothetical protein [Solimicrobium silvestre]PRC90715.1 hypothetical protein S2091_4608 [Solimicrobium silvestre]
MKKLFFSLALVLSISATAQTAEQDRVNAECTVRSFFLQYASEAFGRSGAEPKFRQTQGAFDYVVEKTNNQDLKPKESRELIKSVVNFVYGSLRPDDVSLVSLVNMRDGYRAYCVSHPAEALGDVRVIDLDKALSANTAGSYHVQNKDGGETICSQGKCVSKPQSPPHYGISYSEARKVVVKLGWVPTPSVMSTILRKTGELSTSGTKFGTNEAYGNCLAGSPLCDKSMPELADCGIDGKCTAVWGKDGETFFYFIKGNVITGYGSTPANFINKR